MSPVKRKKTLNKEAIIKAAIIIAEREGAADISIRKIAAHLHVSPMAIYRHFNNKAEILSSMIDRFIEQADVVGHTTADWQKWVIESFQRMLDAMLAHPHFIPLLGGKLIMGSSAIQVTEAVIARLREGGLKKQASVETFFTLINFTIGSANTISANQPDKKTASRKKNSDSHSVETGFLSLSTQTHPNLIELSKPFTSASEGAYFKKSLALILQTYLSNNQTS